MVGDLLQYTRCPRCTTARAAAFSFAVSKYRAYRAQNCGYDAQAHRQRSKRHTIPVWSSWAAAKSRYSCHVSN